MANNPYVNKVVYGNSTLIDLSQDTATQADVAQGKYFHLPTGERVQGTASGGGGTGGIYQDQNGYLVLSPDGDLPTLITKTITQNGTYDAEDDNADGYSSVTVNVSGGGGGGLTLLYSAEVQASTTSTSATSLATLVTGVTFEEGKTYMVSVRDKAGKRNGYFYGTDSYFFIADANFASNTTLASVCIGVDSNGAYSWATTARGVYLYRYYGDTNMGNINIYTRYDSTRGTIDGTYTVKLFEVTIPTT